MMRDSVSGPLLLLQKFNLSGAMVMWSCASALLRWNGWRWLLVAVTVVPCRAAQTQKAATELAPVTIVRKPGHEDGEAQIMEKGKKKPSKIAPHAVSAWRVRGDEAVLVVVLQPAKGSFRSNMFCATTIWTAGAAEYWEDSDEHGNADRDEDDGRIVGRSRLSGNDATDNKPFLVVGDDQAIPGLLPGASSPELHDDTALSYAMGGETKTTKLGVLLGTELHKIYAPPQTRQTAPKYLQVFPNGDAMVELADGSVHKGRWRTNGEIVDLFGDKVAYAVPVSELEPVKGVPAGAAVWREADAGAFVADDARGRYGEGGIDHAGGGRWRDPDSCGIDVRGQGSAGKCGGVGVQA